MPADIASDGTNDLFASYREPAWHRLGTVFNEEVTDSLVMLDLANMRNINVRTLELSDLLPQFQHVSDNRLIVGDFGGSTRVLGQAKGRYEPVQFEEAFAFLQSLQDGARWETAGVLKNGRLGFGSMAFERDFVLDPNGVADVVESYLMVYTTHDGSGGGGGITPTRVVCKNTLNVALGNIKNTFKIRHTRNVSERLAQEAAMWRQANAYMDTFEVEAQALYAKPVSDAKFFAVVDDLFPKPEVDAKGAVAKWETNRAKYAQAWQGAPNAGIKNTAWGAFNALTEANQWGRNKRKGAAGEENFYAAGAGFDAATNAFRNQALELAKAL